MLQQAAYKALMTPDPAEKCRGVDELWAAFEAGEIEFGAWQRAEPVPIPGRPVIPELVPPQQVPRRRLGSPGGRAALVHAIAHIEFNAINLALDAVYRFEGLPESFYTDWLSVAVDEARHFRMLQERLSDLGQGYGDFPAHNGLWEMALKTAGSCLERMALVPRVLEARGLDVTPGMIERLQGAGDAETVAVLEVILDEEVHHVEIGTRWFHWCCAQAGSDPEATFADLMQRHFAGHLKRPFNYPARRAAGFSDRDMDLLERLAK